MTSNKPIIVRICTVILSFIVGMSITLQHGINISLSNWMQHPLRSAWVNFSIGWIAMIPLFIFCNQNTEQDSNARGESAAKHERNSIKQTFVNLLPSFKSDKKNLFVLLNGTCGVIIVVAPIYIAPEIGFALYTISVIFGRIIGSICIDNYGLLWTETKTVSILKLVGAVFVFCGIVLYQVPAFIQSEHGNINIGLIILYLIIAIIAGISTCVQSALNRRMKVLIKGTPYQSVFLCFLNASLILTVINIILYAIKGDWFETHNAYFTWYMFFGGLMGAFVVGMLIVCPGLIGFVATYISVIFGSLIMSIILDYTNAFGVDRKEMLHKSAFRIVGVALVFIGAVLVNIAGGKKKYQKTNTEEDDGSHDDINFSEYDNTCEITET